ncbi:MAG: amino acid ABC transporter substrate-binding protein [Sphingobacteriaceae bacterium]|nr:MAG: amino acid ABC transporter substrate-binding protein [Sphingobacteriaceae bacterium]
MTSVRNHRPPLSGNKWLVVLVAVVLAACSPKIQPVAKKTATKPTEKAAPETAAVEKLKPKVSGKVSTVSLILPFGLDHLSAGASYNAAGLKKAGIALDFYRGFKLALDSLTEQGANYRLQVFDSKDLPAQSHSLALNPQVKNSDLVVGPVFPDGMKAFTSLPNGAKALILSPLSPASPLTYNNPNIITVIPPLEYHAWKAAEFVAKNVRTGKVFILTSGYTEEKSYISYFKTAIDNISKKKVKVIPLTVVRGSLQPIIPQMTKFGRNFILMPSTNQSFIKTVLYSLDTLARRYPVTLFGHPNWDKYAYLKAGQLQKLNTHITSADRVNYKATATKTFVRNYRHLYGSEPSEYAIKAFDEGLYFGQLLADGDSGTAKLNETEFTGLHNSFHFTRKPGQGWINTHVNILKYDNFELKQVE